MCGLLAESAESASHSLQIPQDEPVLGFLLVGGPLVGAQVRDIRLANELVRRGYRVHAWWTFDRPSVSPLDPRITERWLFSWSRYAPWGPPVVTDQLGLLSNRLVPESFRRWFDQACPGFMIRQLRFVLRAVCRGVERDKRLITRFARELEQTRVTHLLPNIEILAHFARAARDQVMSRPRYLVTFQGYEVYGMYAREIGLEQKLFDRLVEVVDDSDWPAIAVSDAYAGRIERELGVAARQLVTIPPGVPTGGVADLQRSRQQVAARFPGYRADVPLITYLGRQDSEKGLDLLLYAMKLLQHQGLEAQLAICGPTAFGATYSRACGQIAEHLRIPVLSSGFVSNELRSALFRASRAVVYPSIHEEPFGMVPVEAMAQGTPVVVPDLGGVADVVAAGGVEGGLRFGCWDSGALAGQLGRLICDEGCYGRLSSGAQAVARHFSVERLGERVLTHLGLPAFSPRLSQSQGNPEETPAFSARAA